MSSTGLKSQKRATTTLEQRGAESAIFLSNGTASSAHAATSSFQPKGEDSDPVLQEHLQKIQKRNDSCYRLDVSGRLCKMQYMPGVHKMGWPVVSVLRCPPFKKAEVQEKLQQECKGEKVLSASVLSAT